jgi:hypothetical protein
MMSLTLILMLLISCNNGAMCDASVFAQQNIPAPYTIVYSVTVLMPSEQMKIQNPPLPISANQKGTILVSSNGDRVLYIVKFGKWQDVIICQRSSDTEFLFDNRFSNALIEPGYNDAISSMILLPLVGVGYDFYPMFQTFINTGSGSATGTLGVPGAVTSGDGTYVQGFVYSQAEVKLALGKFGSTVSSCIIPVPERPSLIEHTWSYSGSRLVQGLPIATDIRHTEYYSTVQNQWPPSEMAKGGETVYKLISASSTAVTKAQFMLENYIPPGSFVNDSRPLASLSSK